MLDIGGEMGAVVLFTPPTFLGREIEVSPVGRDDQRVHTEVLRREVGGRTVFAAVYAQLPAGEYRIWGEADRPRRVTVVGGQVAEVHWR